MDVVIRTGFEAVSFSINFYTETIRKGKLLVLANHVKRVEEVRGIHGHSLIRSSVIRTTSINSAPYQVSLEVCEKLLLNILVNL